MGDLCIFDHTEQLSRSKLDIRPDRLMSEFINVMTALCLMPDDRPSVLSPAVFDPLPSFVHLWKRPTAPILVQTTCRPLPTACPCIFLRRIGCLLYKSVQEDSHCSRHRSHCQRYRSNRRSRCQYHHRNPRVRANRRPDLDQGTD